MTFNNFRLNIVFRVVLLALFIAGFMYCLFRIHWVITPVILFAAVVAVVAELVFYLESSNREFTNFLLAIKSADFSKHNVVDKRGRSFAAMEQALNVIIEEFQQVRVANEANYTFLQTMVGHIKTAIISFSDTGEIKLINETAKTLLNLSYLKNIYFLQQTNPELCGHLIRPHDANQVIELEVGSERLKLSIHATYFKIQGIGHKLISIQDIRTEIEHTETEAWEQLLHVLTHEIMNSITPISSLSATLKNKVDTLQQDTQLDQDTIDDMSLGLNVIARRSVGLMKFVDHYKSLITLPAPNIKELELKTLLEWILRLKHNEIKAKNIELKVNVSEDALMIKCDPDLVGQVLINLLNNAMDALTHTSPAHIELSATVVNAVTIISIADNGPGIDKDNLDKIFIPFFTTKNTGSGIGLSLSRQIMHMHGGSIYVSSSLGNGVVFSLEFPM